jgi:hypothetical protein
MTPQQIIDSLRGILNSSSLFQIPTEQKVAIRHLLRIIEVALLSS